MQQFAIHCMVPNRDGELFQVRTASVIETNADGTKRLRTVKNIDVTHAYVGHYGCHIQHKVQRDNFRTLAGHVALNTLSRDNLG